MAGATEIRRTETVDSEKRNEALTVVVSGASGLVGTALQQLLKSGGHRVRKLVRREHDLAADEIQWNIEAGTLQSAGLEGADAVINLAGENIAGRWTAAKKTRILESRVKGTRLLCENLARLKRKPEVLVNASAVGYYGNSGDTELIETSPGGSGFLADVCFEWEKATRAAQDAGIRVVHARIGVVLSPHGGALSKMLTPFKLCAGGIMGSGRQHWSWIAIDDVVGALQHAVVTPSIHGPMNVVAPEPATNREFTKALGKVLSRPTLFPMPAFAARLALGEMADELLLASIRVKPAKLQRTGYTFRFPKLENALQHLLA